MLAPPPSRVTQEVSPLIRGITGKGIAGACCPAGTWTTAFIEILRAATRTVVLSRRVITMLREIVACYVC